MRSRPDEPPPKPSSRQSYALSACSRRLRDARIVPRRVVSRERRCTSECARRPDRGVEGSVGVGAGRADRGGEPRAGRGVRTVPLSELAGLCGVPRDKRAAAAHLERTGVALWREVRNGGEARVADVADLPRDLQAALWARWAEKAAGSGVDIGCADPALQEAFWRKPATVREKG